ncbi:hypothetical protein LP416_27950 [Polaromonas sp. P2-4]|nr:hypothetical protein LP416_27950 [Polaromonas sp. P2-4]
MAIIACKECGGKVSDMANTCPHCGVGVTVPMPAAPVAVPAEKQGSTWWKWVLGVPVGLFVLVMAIGSANSNPEKTQARRVYELCRSDLESADRARSSAGPTIAGVCENLRSDFVRKYNSNP